METYTEAPASSNKANGAMNGAFQSKRQRSPQSPCMSLAEASRLIKVLQEKMGSGVRHPTLVAQYLGRSPKSGDFNRMLSTFRQYGLVEYAGDGDSPKKDQIKISRLGCEIATFDGDSRLKALRKAALNPPVFAALVRRYSGTLPVDSFLKAELIHDLQFSDGSADDLIMYLRETMSYASIGEDFGQMDLGDSNQEVAVETEGMDMETGMGTGGEAVGQTMQSKAAAPTGRQMKITVPMSSGEDGAIVLPREMSDSDWTFMMGILESYKPRLVKQ